MPARSEGFMGSGNFSAWGVMGAALSGSLALAQPAAALEEGSGEWDKIKACEERLCTLILDKPAKGEDLACKLTKTWPKSTLDGGESKLVKWGFGDARCSVDLRLARATIVSSLTEKKFVLEIPEHQVKCEVETGGALKPVNLKLSPRIEFKKGKADKIWINLKDVSGPASIKTTIWAAANIEDSLGVFHKSMIKSVNKFMHKQCPKRYGPNAVAEDEEPVEDTAKSAEAKEKPAVTQTAATPEKAAVPAMAPAAEVKSASPAAPASAKEEPAPRVASKPAIKLELKTRSPWDIPSKPAAGSD